MALRNPTLRAPVRLMGGVRDTLNEAQLAFTEDSADDDPELDLEDDLAAGAALEGRMGEVEQLVRGNTGAHEGAGLLGAVEGLVTEPEGDAEDAVPMTEDELSGIIETELADSIGSESDEVDGSRSKALDYYFGRPRGDEKEGRSVLQSLDLADMVESVLAQIIPAFTEDLSVEFETLSGDPMGVKTAQDESAATNYVVQKENDGFTNFYQLFKDALLMSNCVAKIALDESLEVGIEEHRNVNPQMLMALQQPRSPGEQVVVDSVDQDETGVTVVIKRITKNRKIKISPVPLDEFRVNSDHDSPTLYDARFTCHKCIKRESELAAMGFDREVLADLPSSSGSTESTADARAQSYQETEVDTANPNDRPIDVEECWMLVDFDGDGLAERRQVLRAGNNTILSNTPTNYMGLVSGTGYINPHKWIGIGLFQKLKNVQDYKTHFLRQAADNANVANNSRTWFIKGQVNEDHLFNSMPGGGVAVKRPDALGQLNTPNVLPAVFQMLEYGDKMRTERAGASLDMQSQQVPLQNRTAHGAERVVSSMEQITALVSKTLAKTIVSGIYLTTHHLLREYFPQGYVFPKDGQMQQVQPGQWGPRKGVGLKLGLSIGERLKMAAALQGVIAQQAQMLQAGQDGTLVNVSNMYQAVLDFARMSGLSNPQQYWVDPNSQQGQQAAQQKAQAAQAQQQAQQQSQQQIIDLQKQVIDSQEQTKRMAAELKAKTEEAKLLEDQRQHTEDTATQLTEMELKYNQEIPEAKA